MNTPLIGRRASGSTGWVWAVAPCVSALLVLVPIVTIFLSWTSDQGDVWQHLIDTQLPRLLTNTLILLLGVGVMVTVVGVGLAWLTTVCEFPGRRFLDWALMLPLALPAYVLAFVVLGQWDYMGPVQSALRQWLDPGFGVDVRNPVTVVLVLAGVLYPYVYMLSRSAFISQGSDIMEAARSMGLSPWQAFFQVSLPMARPAIAAGVSLALMEALADFGAVSVFNFDTFTTAIYKSWFGLYSLPAAAQLSSLLLLCVALSLVGERMGRGRRRFDQAGRPLHQHRFTLLGWRRYLVVLLTFGIFIGTFVLPTIQLCIWTREVARQAMTDRYWELLAHTVSLGLAAAVLIVVTALFVAISLRQRPGVWLRAAGLVSTMGYALPGSVLAVGVALGFGEIDSALRRLPGWHGPVLLGGLGALLLAYFIRFMAVAYGPVESSLQQIRPSIPEVARLLGAGQWRVVWAVYVPILRPGLLAGALLVLVDVMKEMPATLLMRPFGWDTLAVKVYEMTSEGEWERAAPPALSIVLVGLIPVALTIRHQTNHR